MGRWIHDALLRDRDKLPSVDCSHFHRYVTRVHRIPTDANNGLDDIVETQRPFAIKHGVSFGDL